MTLSEIRAHYEQAYACNECDQHLYIKALLDHADTLAKLAATAVDHIETVVDTCTVDGDFDKNGDAYSQEVRAADKFVDQARTKLGEIA